MYRKFVVATVAALLVVGIVAGMAFAAVTFDPATGAGFVGKGDVQLVFGWNNAQLQANARGVSFAYIATENYEAVCTWITGEGTKGEKTHNVTHTATAGVNSVIQYDSRTHKQIDGFILTGLGATTETGAVPVVGGPCPGNPGTDGTWSSVTLVSSSGGLFVNYGASSVQIWP